MRKTINITLFLRYPKAQDISMVGNFVSPLWTPVCMRNISGVRTYKRLISVLTSFRWRQGLNQDCWIQCLCSVINSVMLHIFAAISLLMVRGEAEPETWYFYYEYVWDHKSRMTNQEQRIDGPFFFPDAHRRWLNVAIFFYCSGNVCLNTCSLVYLSSIINIHILLTIKL